MTEFKPETVADLLNHIQVNMKAPKNLFNSFGKYNYRNAESILEAVKPYLFGGTLKLEDEPVVIANRVYIRTTARLTFKGGIEEAKAYAREPEVKKGMDESQITGASASYAAKRALGNLFLLDDTKDADSDEKPGKEEKPSKADVRLISEINQLTTESGAKEWWGMNERDILDLPEDQQNLVDEQFQAKLKSIEDGIATPSPFRWGSVPESRAWAKEFTVKIDACTTPIALNNLIAANKVRIDAMTGMAEGVSDKQRMMDKVEAKRATFDTRMAG